MRLTLTGIGLSSAEMDLDKLQQTSLKQETILPQNNTADTSDLNNFFPPRALRRVDHFTRMSLLAASYALQDHLKQTPETQESQNTLPEQTGIIVGSGYGPSKTVFSFLDSIIEHGAECASPLAFSHSVHNIPTATICLFMKSQSPYTTICQTHGPLFSALTNAACWLAEGRVENVLTGVVDEKTELLEECTRRLLSEKKPEPKLIPTGEGAAFFMLSKASAEGSESMPVIEFEMVNSKQLKNKIHTSTVFAPQKTLGRLGNLGIKARASIAADMPTAAGIELISAILAARRTGTAACIEQVRENFALFKVLGSNG